MYWFNKDALVRFWELNVVVIDHLKAKLDWLFALTIVFLSIYFRLKSYVRKTRTIQIDSEKVTYIAADKEVKIYADNSSNGLKRNMKNVSMIFQSFLLTFLYCKHFQILWCCRLSQFPWCLNYWFHWSKIKGF